MKIGVGLPATIPGAPADVVLEWARKGDKLGFSSLGIINRIVYKNYESMVTLAAAAGVTRKVRLMTSVVVAPARESVLLAKQAATVDRISNGRLTLGMGVGARKDDFDATHTSFKTRGRRFDEQLRLMKSVWSGHSVSETAGAVGPQVVQKGGPEVLIGGYGAGVAPRVAKWGDGYVSGGVPAEAAAAVFKSVKEAWGKAGRAGKPRLVCSTYFALGGKAAERGAVYLRDYYGYLGSWADNVVNGILGSADKVKKAIGSYEAVGADEVMLWPTIAEVEQLDMLSELL